jgi:hypothetical protein
MRKMFDEKVGNADFFIKHFGVNPEISGAKFSGESLYSVGG